MLLKWYFFSFNNIPRLRLCWWTWKGNATVCKQKLSLALSNTHAGISLLIDLWFFLIIFIQKFQKIFLELNQISKFYHLMIMYNLFNWIIKINWVEKSAECDYTKQHLKIDHNKVIMVWCRFWKLMEMWSMQMPTRWLICLDRCEWIWSITLVVSTS